MRRKLNENVSDKLYLDVTVMAQNDPDLDFNNLRDTLVANGAIVNGKETDDNHVIMVVEELPKEQVEEVLDSLLTYGYDSTIDDDYFTELNEDEDDVLNSERDYPDYDDVNINEDVDSIEENDCPSDDYECMATDELDYALKSIQGIKGDLMFEPAVVLDTVIDDVNVEVFSVNSDGLADTNVGMLDLLTEIKDVNDLYTLADVINDLVDAYEDDEDIEEVMPKFEKMKGKRRLEEKRTPCCPTKKIINEKLKAHDAKQQEKLDKIEANIKLVLDDINRSTIGAHEAREAFKKLKEENKKLRKINKDEENKFSVVDVPGVKKSLKHLANVDSETAKNIEALEKSLVEKVTKALKENRSCLYENVKVNGKSLKEYSLDELYKLFNKLTVIKENLTAKLRGSLNESDLTALKNELKQKNLLMEYIDNEITYRETRKQFVVNEDGEISDEELKNLFGPSQGEDENDTEGDNESNDADNADKEDNDDTSDKDNSNDEEDEVHELSRIEITLTTMEAAVDLKDACIAAGIPEDAIEIDDNEEATEEDETSNEDENSEESEESGNEEENSEEENSEEQNEAYNYRNITNLLFEAEETEETSEENDNKEENGENSEESEESGNEEENSEETEENKGVKFILVNTDYTLTLVKILEDQYDISKEELEDMIGAELIDESEDEESDDDKEDKETKEDKESKKEDEKDGKSKEGKEDDDLDIDPSDLFKGL